MKMVVSTLRTFPYGMDKPYTDIPNLRVVITRKAMDVGGTGLNYWCGLGKFGKHGQWFDVCKPATADHIDYWFRQTTAEKQVLIEHTGTPKGWHGRTV